MFVRTAVDDDPGGLRSGARMEESGVVGIGLLEEELLTARTI
jgi:hypothetical protein